MKKKYIAVSGALLGFLLLIFGFIGLKLGSVVKSTEIMKQWHSIHRPFLYGGAVLTLVSMIWGNTVSGPKHDKWIAYIMILPAMIALVVFILYPIANVIYLSGFKGGVIKPTKEFVGVSNYPYLFSKPAFQAAVKNTFTYTITYVILTICISLLMAIWLFDNRALNKICQTIIFLPHLIATVSCAFIWRWVFDYNDYGLLNSFLRMFGIGPVPWLESSKYALGCITVMNTWKSIGYYTLIFIASMKNIPEDIQEAAKLDGANGAKRFIRITFPLISPQIFFSLVLLTIGSFNIFDSVNAMTAGGPSSSTEVISRFIYTFAFSNATSLGLGCAAAVFLMSLQLIMTILYFRLLEKRVHYQ